MDGLMRVQPAKKRAMTMFVDIELLDAARRVDIMERHLRSLVRAERERCWLRDDQEAIAHYNRRVVDHGLLSDDAGPWQWP
jgi:post-segregation antitoxin (ccd killing protein)